MSFLRDYVKKTTEKEIAESTKDSGENAASGKFMRLVFLFIIVNRNNPGLETHNSLFIYMLLS